VDKTAAWDWLAKVRAEVLKALEAARNEKKINSGLEAKVLLGGNPDLRAKLNHHIAQLPGPFIVWKVGFLTAGASDYKSELVPSLEVSIQRADGTKCEPCWNYSIHVGENSRYPKICERCSAVIAEIEGATC